MILMGLGEKFKKLKLIQIFLRKVICLIYSDDQDKNNFIKSNIRNNGNFFLKYKLFKNLIKIRLIE